MTHCDDWPFEAALSLAEGLLTQAIETVPSEYLGAVLALLPGALEFVLTFESEANCAP